ncbi:DIS3-like exonuclease 1 isoform X2 [Pocillopora verrucosa]|uniref:DIS3-like exonuclease 1 isoform X2 n=1 Tax=Pocillopora verrucosa TaxID=203993 RepID=UPI00333F7605
MESNADQVVVSLEKWPLFHIHERRNMIKTNKLLRLKRKTGRLLDVVREHYPLKDVPCHSEVCAVCEQGSGTLFCKSLTQYVVPDCLVQHQGGRKLQSQLKDIVNNNRQQSIIFSNEFCDGAYVSRESKESSEEWQWR